MLPAQTSFDNDFQALPAGELKNYYGRPTNCIARDPSGEKGPEKNAVFIPRKAKKFHRYQAEGS